MKKIIENKKYFFLGILFILVLLIPLVIFSFSKSYALEGFGQVNLTCDKTVAVGGENISCTATGTVAAESQVPALSSVIELSDNLEFVSFTTDSSWLGDGTDGKIELYTDVNKSSTFPIGTFTVKVKEGVVNTEESIQFVKTYFYDKDFKEQAVKDATLKVKTPQYASKDYSIKDDYIIVNTKEIKTILSSIQTEGCTAVVHNNNQDVTSGTIQEGASVKIVSNSKVLKELSVIYINSEKYDLTKDYLLTSLDSLDDIISDVEVINGTLSVKNGKLVLSHNSTGIYEYDILNLTSDKYFVDIQKKVMLVSDEIDDSLKNNIHISSNMSMARDGEVLKISYKNNVILELAIVHLDSSIYQVDLKNRYVYILFDSLENSILSKFNSNATLSITNNKLSISKNNEIVSRLDVINLKTDKYLIHSTSGGEDSYIYTQTDFTSDEVLKNVTSLNGKLSLENDQLILSYNGKRVDYYNILYFTSNDYSFKDKTILTKEVVDYNTFISKISFKGLTYQVCNTLSTEVTSGNIEDNYYLRLLRDGVIVDTYKIRVEYFELKNLAVNDENKIIYNLNLNSTYNDLIKNIDTSGEVRFFDKNNRQLQLSDKVMTYSTLQVKLSSGTKTYQLSVFGDVTGTGTVTAGDIAKIYQAVKGKITLDTVSTLAADVTHDGKIAVNDVAKAYSYLKGKISSFN